MRHTTTLMIPTVAATMMAKPNSVPYQPDRWPASRTSATRISSAMVAGITRRTSSPPGLSAKTRASTPSAGRMARVANPVTTTVTALGIDIDAYACSR